MFVDTVSVKLSLHKLSHGSNNFDSNYMMINFKVSAYNKYGFHLTLTQRNYP